MSDSVGESPGLLDRVRSPMLLGGIGIGLMVVGGLLLALSGPAPMPPQQRLARALERLGERTTTGDRAARSAARRLLAEEFHDPEFGGALEFILGIVEFRTAQNAEELANDEQYAEAIRLLREAERRTLLETWRPEWSYAMGVGLAWTGETHAAERHLRDAIAGLEEHGAVGQVPPLVEAILATRDTKLLEQGLRLNESVASGDDTEKLDRNLLQRARLLLALGRDAEAEAMFDTISASGRDTDRARLFRGRAFIADAAFQEAIDVLSRVVQRNDEGRTRREATFLTGRASESLADTDNAIRFYGLVADAHPRSHEGVAARLRAAELLRLAGRREESLDAYRQLMEHTPPAPEFRNRWLDLEEFRATVVGAWTALQDEGAFEDAIELASLLEPLFPGAGAPELVAKATTRWAEHDQAELEGAAWSERYAMRPSVIERWRAAGEAYDALSHELRTSTQFGPALYEASRHHARGHAFETALARLDEFIETRPRELLPDALLQRGHTLFDLGRIDDARTQFEEVSERFPTSPTAYEARFEIGRCHLEQDRRDDAHEAWSAILASPELGPSADVWRKSLFALAKLAYHWARADHRKAARTEAEAEAETDEPNDGLQSAYTRWDEAVRRLEEYLRRYGAGAGSIEARYLLARALLERADEPRRELRRAETENTRNELRRQVEQLLLRSIDEHRLLQEALLPREGDDRLAPTQRNFLDNSYLDVARAYFDLRMYDQAIVTYAAAANRFADDSRVLVCYVQMSNAYSLLDRPIEARSMLRQAKLILERMPDTSFTAETTSLTRADWDRWIDWAHERTGDEAAPEDNPLRRDET